MGDGDCGARADDASDDVSRSTGYGDLTWQSEVLHWKWSISFDGMQHCVLFRTISPITHFLVVLLISDRKFHGVIGSSRLLKPACVLFAAEDRVCACCCKRGASQDVGHVKIRTIYDRRPEDSLEMFHDA